MTVEHWQKKSCKQYTRFYIFQTNSNGYEVTTYLSTKEQSSKYLLENLEVIDGKTPGWVADWVNLKCIWIDDTVE